MKAEEKQIQLRKKTAAINYRYNRFLLLRYLLAVTFFVHLNGLLITFLAQSFLSLALASILLLVDVFAVGEQVSLYGARENDRSQSLKRNYCCFLSQFTVNAVLLVVAVFNLGFTAFFPFLKNTGQSRGLIAVVTLMGVFLAGIAVFRIQKIAKKKDKYYLSIKKFEKTMN